MAKSKKRWVRRPLEVREQLVREWRASGRSRNAFARERGIPVSSLWRWTNMLDQAPDKSESAGTSVAGFVELPSPVATSAATAVLRLQVGDAVAEFVELPPATYLADVCLALERRPC